MKWQDWPEAGDVLKFENGESRMIKASDPTNTYRVEGPFEVPDPAGGRVVEYLLLASWPEAMGHLGVPTELYRGGTKLWERRLP